MCKFGYSAGRKERGGCRGLLTNFPSHIGTLKASEAACLKQTEKEEFWGMLSDINLRHSHVPPSHLPTYRKGGVFFKIQIKQGDL